MDLNELVQNYKISKSGGVEELKNLQEKISNVPINLNYFLKYLEETYFTNEFGLITLAEFYNPDVRLDNLIDLVDNEKADDLSGKINYPSPQIYINGDNIETNFYENTIEIFGRLISKDSDKPSCEILSKNKFPVIGIIYGNHKDDKLDYLELILTKSNL
jgi:hypothetical protein